MQLTILKMFVFMKDVQTLHIHFIFGISIENLIFFFSCMYYSIITYSFSEVKNYKLK